MTVDLLQAGVLVEASMRLTVLARLAPFDVLDSDSEAEEGVQVSEAEEGIDVPAPVPKFTSFPAKKSLAQTTESLTMAPRNGNPNCSAPELMNMLQLLEEHPPIGEAAWKKVCQLHSEAHPHRDVKSNCREFTTLCRGNIPTGDPGCPEEVILAKRVHFLLGQKAAVGDGEEDFDLKELKHGETGANPKPCAQTLAEEVVANASGAASDGAANMSAVTQSTPVVKRSCQSVAAMKDGWIDVMKANMEAEREERKVRCEEREEERRDGQLQLDEERKLRAEERAEDRAFR